MYLDFISCTLHNLPDLTPMGSTGILSPFSSSGSQGNMSTSPMSTSSSPMHVTDDYINLTNAGMYSNFKSSSLRLTNTIPICV